MALLASPFGTKEARLAACKRAASRPVSAEVYSELAEQNRHPSPGQEASLDKLKLPGAVAVVTGQQLGLCGGPLFTFYKALGAIKAARELEAELNISAVPIFWLQSEDHDYDEIRGATFFGPEGKPTYVQLPEKIEGGEDSVGAVSLSAEALAQFREDLHTALGHTLAKKDIELLLEPYQSGATFGQAFKTILNTFLGSFGVLFFDTSKHSVKNYLRPLIRRAIEDWGVIEEILKSRSLELEKLGVPVQVQIKERSPLVFVSVDGKRQRFTSGGTGRWRGVTFDYKDHQLWRLLDEQPEKFTSSALLRPLMQDSLFPTAAYICGPAEMQYWYQITPLYEHFGIPQPMVVPRPSFLVLEPWCRRAMEKFALRLEDLDDSVDSLIARRYRTSSFDPQRLFGELQGDIFASLDSVVPQLNELDANGLGEALETTRTAITANLHKFKARYMKALAVKETALVGQFKRLQSFVLPGGVPQERVIAGAYFALKYPKEFLTKALEVIEPFPEDTNEASLKDGFPVKKLNLGEG